jgi:phosphoglycolate phosphatase
MLLCAERLWVQPSKCLPIGDDPRDIASAKAAGMAAVAALWGTLGSNVTESVGSHSHARSALDIHSFLRIN